MNTNIDEIKKYVKETLSERRYYHSECVMQRAIELAKIYNANIEKAALAGITHDLAKEMSKEDKLKYAEENGLEVDEIERANPGLLHGKIAADICKKKYGFDEEIQGAIAYHTTGKENMSLLEKIIYLADCSGKDRDVKDLEYFRDLCNTDLNGAVIYCLEFSICENFKKKKLVHPRSLNARNYLLENIK